MLRVNFNRKQSQQNLLETIHSTKTTNSSIASIQILMKFMCIKNVLKNKIKREFSYEFFLQIKGSKHISTANSAGLEICSQYMCQMKIECCYEKGLSINLFDDYFVI